VARETMLLASEAKSHLVHEQVEVFCMMAKLKVVHKRVGLGRV